MRRPIVNIPVGLALLAMASALVLGACSTGEVSRSAAGASEAALLPSDAASSAIASAEASSESAPDEVAGPPQAPVAASWREVAPHQVKWSVWTPETDTVAAVEAVITTSGTGQAVPCSPDAESSTQSRSFWSCTLLGRQGPQTARVRAMNPSGTSPWTEVQVTFNRGSCTDAVAAAGVCEEFDTGPGGGFVFYDAGSRQPWGQYLEAAPAGWAGTGQDPKAAWCAEGQPGYGQSLPTGTGIGSGAANTALIIANCGTDSAAGLAAAYRGGGKTDWFLASKDELSKMRDRRTEIGGLATKDSFWSSSQYDNSSTNSVISAWEDVLDDKDAGGQLDGGYKYMPNRVRPIRAS